MAYDANGNWVDDMPEGQMPVEGMPTPIYEQAIAVAIVVDDEIADILYTNDKLASALLSQPKLIDVTTLMSDPFIHPATGWAYDEEQNSFIGRDNDGNPVSLSL